MQEFVDSNENKIKVSIYFLDETDISELACKYIILYINSIQSIFEFQFPENESILSSHPPTPEQEKSIKSHESDPNLKNIYMFLNLIQDNEFADCATFHIGIINEPLENNYFFVSSDNLSIVTTHNWDKLFSPPSVFEYIIHCLNGSLVQMSSSIRSHSETRGCFLDYTRFKNDDKIDIILGYICNDCRGIIKSEHGDEFLQSVEKIASRDWIGRLDVPDSVAYNLKKYYKIDIEKDSGFNKSYWEKAREHFPTLPAEIIKVTITGIVSAIFTLVTLYLTGLLKLE